LGGGPNFSLLSHSSSMYVTVRSYDMLSLSLLTTKVRLMRHSMQHVVRYLSSLDSRRNIECGNESAVLATNCYFKFTLDGISCGGDSTFTMMWYFVLNKTKCTGSRL
jgi:hypothetical protein